MSLYLFATDFRVPLPEEQFSYLLEQLPVPLQQKVLRFRRWQDGYGSLFGKLLLRLALKETGFHADLGGLQYDTFNRPFLQHAPDFNIAHSANRVVCIVNTGGRVGIDIEFIKELSFDDFQTQFTAAEWAFIHRARLPLAAFYQLWTAKESIIKADGRGLGIPLQEVDLSDKRDVLVDPPRWADSDGLLDSTRWADNDVLLDSTRWAVKGLPFFDEYACHICVEASGASLPSIQLHQLTPAEVLGAFAS